ncbi:MAG: hypothetical protein LIO58_03790 [Oscillospiraceae bacterium]|nr:hypothetical protein [Oscillospiraceae bacterium]
MPDEPMRTLAYICPACLQPVAVERSLFQLSAADSELFCPCEKSSLVTAPDGSHVTVTVPCIFCGKDHTVRCAAEAFAHETVLAFSCAPTGLDCCYVGEEGAVFAKLRRLEGIVDKLTQRSAAGDGNFLDDLVMQEVLSEIRDIAKRDGISCTCGSHRWNLQVNYSAVLLSCTECGGVMRIPAAASEDIEAICCHDRLLIPQANTNRPHGEERQ